MSGITVPTLDEITGHTVMAKLRSLCKKFIGLAQEVDDKIDAPLEEAHLAVETANATLATAQESLEDAESAVTTANSASATANEASESAQESAETVAGYNTRLTTVENEKLNITNVNNYAVGLTGNQTVSGDKLYLQRIQGNANFGTGGASAYMEAGQYNTIFILPKTSISTFRAVIFAVAFRRASGSNPVFVSIAFHGVTATGISKWGSELGSVEYFTSEDDDNVYIGIKARSSGLQDNAIQMILTTSVGFNYSPIVNNASGTPTDTPPGTLIAETS